MTIDIYNEDWEEFTRYIEKKIKGKCSINNKNWLKLRDFHFEQFIKKVPHPYGLIFRMIYMSQVHRDIPCIYKVYKKYRKEIMQDAKVVKIKSRADAFRKHR